VLLLAPTGKAAHRLGESLAAGARELDCAEDVRALVGGRAMTIHRALGRAGRWRTRFRHHRANPLRAGIVVVDEASMVDISLMSRLLDAVAPAARVVLLGDRDQLASVEAGAILADVCGEADRFEYSPDLAKQVAALGGGDVASAGAASRGGATTPAVRDAIVQLRRNYRYDENSDIGRLAAAINAGDVGAVLRVLTAQSDGPVALRPGLEVDSSPYQGFERAYDGLFADVSAAERLRSLDRFRVLCAVRRGPLGVEGVNQRIEEGLRLSGSIATDGEHYPGRPVMVLHNDAETELFNGDVGLLLEGEGGGMRAHFRDRAEVRSLSIARVPAHETVYAMTIHKSQGSEFDEVAVVLPDQPSPLLTRELLYTAVTRARRKVTIYASPDIVAKAVEQRVARASGLVERLWSTPPAAKKRRR
jgi:exodeoxyribonuclease V alpha subunit